MRLENRLAVYLACPERYTLWTFIKYFERSKDPKHCRRLKNKMENALKELHARGEVIRCKSVRGKTAYRSRDDYPADVPF